MIDGFPDVLRAGHAQRVSLEIALGSPTVPSVGVSMTATNGLLACGEEFLATHGHRYRVSCTLTPSAGRGTLSLLTHNAGTGRVIERATARTLAR